MVIASSCCFLVLLVHCNTVITKCITLGILVFSNHASPQLNRILSIPPWLHPVCGEEILSTVFMNLKCSSLVFYHLNVPTAL